VILGHRTWLLVPDTKVERPSSTAHIRRRGWRSWDLCEKAMGSMVWVNYIYWWLSENEMRVSWGHLIIVDVVEVLIINLRGGGFS